MDKLEHYRKIITQILQKHAQHKPSHGDIEALLLCDPITDNYLLLDTGWDRTGRVHAVVLHLRIFGEKIWIESDGTETGIALELLELNIPKEDIVLGFIRPKSRHLTYFSIA
ncbi:XisI protein [Limnoraphis robusta Tam1]|uniref:XisI protein n=1 Tax=Limnoraphis robusta TaxID=1118279 RepID=UPI002B2072A9|nr:XisI protein [Limnoraphis robusta]MEA5500008.1 XisI protein [Limnoraphis robusta BA-68 BA1]MEA5539621.1 XisI protein [Limnoraphis robusta Tam1]